MVSYNEQMQRLFSRFEAEVSDGVPVELDVVYDWARQESLWSPREEDIRAQFKSEMAQALREEYRTDPSGRKYRAKHPYRGKSPTGKQLSFWGDIDKSPHEYMVQAFAQRRRRIAGECHQLKVDVDHFNEVRSDEQPYQLSLNFEDDVLERLIDEGLADAA